MDRIKAEIIKSLKSFKKHLQKMCPLQKIILFGSYARNTQDQNSDIDLIVVSESFAGQRQRKRSPPLYMLWDLDYPVDFLCYTPEEFEQRSKLQTICRTAKEEGLEV
jgi:predicted nucleotidyltransferase